MTTIEMMNNLVTEQQTKKDEYLAAEAKLVEPIGELILGTEVACVSYGNGTITKVSGTTVDNIIIDIAFNNNIKKFSLPHVMVKSNFIKFVSLDLSEIWKATLEAHTYLTAEYKAFEVSARQSMSDLEKKAEADKKAEEKYLRLKENSVKAFDEMSNRVFISSPDEEFYYALGWLANHIGSMTATLPDYLGSAFEKHFGIETPKTLVDSRAKTSGGYAKQWSWEFRCTIKKLADTCVPSCIQNVTTDFSKGIHNTSFLWDLIDNYGFQFGKKQDVEKIAENIPVKYIEFFNAGLVG